MSKNDSTDFIKAVRVNDKYGIKELIDSGRVFLIDNKTKVLLINKGFLGWEVRILEDK